MPPCWRGRCLRCRVVCCWRSRNGRRSIVSSITVRRRLTSHPRWAKPYAGLHSWAALWGAAAVTNQEPKRCGVAFSISVISRKCIVLCAPLHPKRKDVSIWQLQDGGIAEGFNDEYRKYTAIFHAYSGA